jgi:RimJ/RimL family protein N-acetyltransferase
VGLQAETVERVRGYWSAWAAGTDLQDRVSVVMLGSERFTCAPRHLRDRIEGAELEDLSSLVGILGDDVEAVVGEARLSYTDAATLRPVAISGVTEIADDVRLAVLRAASDPNEWSEAGVDEPGAFRCAVVDDDSLLAVATLRVWDDALGQLGVFTAAHARRRGLASAAGAAAATHALTLGLVPQWRSLIGNDASTRVADRLGFVDLGRQMTVRVVGA